jgi:8-oxo-dGTP diphosphatase
MFDFDLAHVLLIRKNKPDWQVGKLNGVGGKVEESDSDTTFTMCREFSEEVGVWEGALVGFQTEVKDWSHFACLSDQRGWNIDFFYSRAKYVLQDFKSMTDEKLEVILVSEIPSRTDLIMNLQYLVPMAINHVLKRDRAGFFSIVELPATSLFSQPVSTQESK